MGNERLPELLNCGCMYGHCPRGRPKKKWIDNIGEYVGHAYVYVPSISLHHHHHQT